MTSTSGPARPKDMSLAAMIGDVGRRLRARTLGLILLGGSLGVAGILVLLPKHRMLATPFLMPVTFGIWGLALHAERTLEPYGHETNVERALLRALRVVMVVLGGLAAVATIADLTFALSGSGGLLLR